MRIVSSDYIKNAVCNIFSEICCEIDSKTVDALSCAYNNEISEKSKFALNILLTNSKIAKEEKIAACQDTGMAVVFIDIGENVFIDGNINSAVNEGIKLAYKDYYRKSVLDPITRINTSDNTPAVIYLNEIKGDKVFIHGMAKGFGSENMCKVYMLNPSDGVDGIKKSVIECVKTAGSCPCPPIIVGIGIGGTMDKAAIMSKTALLREIHSNNSDQALNNLEKELLIDINKLNIGAGGFGGNTTALAVFIEKYPTHIAGLPLAITIQCHCNRHKSVEI